MKIQRALAAAALAVVAAMPSAAGELFTKAFQFKPNTKLEVGADLPNGLRLDSIEFGVAAEGDHSPTSLFGQPKAQVAISNLAQHSASVGIIIALMDEEGRLLGVASGGTKMFPLRAQRQMTYALVFDDVNSEASKATVFRISIETRP